MVIFNSYVKLPEGTTNIPEKIPKIRSHMVPPSSGIEARKPLLSLLRGELVALEFVEALEEPQRHAVAPGHGKSMLCSWRKSWKTMGKFMGKSWFELFKPSRISWTFHRKIAQK